MGTIRRKWSEEDETIFIKMLRSHADKYEIEKALHRSEESINARLYKMYKTTDIMHIYEKRMI